MGTAHLVAKNIPHVAPRVRQPSDDQLGGDTRRKVRDVNEVDITGVGPGDRNRGAALLAHTLTRRRSSRRHCWNHLRHIGQGKSGSNRRD